MTDSTTSDGTTTWVRWSVVAAATASLVGAAVWGLWRTGAPWPHLGWALGVWLLVALVLLSVVWVANIVVWVAREGTRSDGRSYQPMGTGLLAALGWTVVAMVAVAANTAQWVAGRMHHPHDEWAEEPVRQ
ncbi:MAG: hypothetical protein FWF02_03670 [Micrococcales bacterium]|nr:hypothetical protein [Micrococcales bacterium]MCL2666788.1 hypothetical protein [Micrococcales bacterium]